MSSDVPASAASSSIPDGGAHLTLHLDVNGTLTPIDSVDSGRRRELVNLFLAKNTYGHPEGEGEGDAARWILAPGDTFHEPDVSVKKHSYFTWLKRKLGPAVFRQEMTYDFTEPGQPGERLASYAEELMQFYPPDDAPAGTRPARGPLFPSAVRLLHHFPRARIVLRTFGHDALLIVRAVSQALEEGGSPARHFIGFRLHRPPEAEKDALFELRRVGTQQEEAAAATAGDALSAIPSTVRGSAAELGAFLESLHCDAYILDDYMHWNSRRRAREEGKPIFPSPAANGIGNGKGRLVVSFDDNDCMHLPQHHANVAESGAAAASSSSEPAHAHAHAHPHLAHFVHVRPLLALRDEDYFVRALDALWAEHQHLATEEK